LLRFQFRMNFTMLLILEAVVMAQTDIPAIHDTALANQYFVKAEKLATATQYDSSTFYCLKAAIFYKQIAAQFSLPQFPAKQITCYNKIIENCTLTREYDLALAYADTALEAGLKFFGENHPVVAKTYHRLGYVYTKLGPAAKAREFYRKSLAINLKVRGENHPDVAATYGNLAILDMDIGDLDRALLYTEKAAAIFRQAFGDNYPQLANAYENIGFIYGHMGDDDQAFEFNSKALAIRRRNYGDDHPALVGSYGNLANIYMHRRDYDKAIEYLNKALDINRKRNGEISLRVSGVYRNLGVVYYRMQDDQKAFDFFNKALSIERQLLREYDGGMGSTYQKLGKFFETQKQYETALRYYQKSIICWTRSFADTNIYANPSLNQMYPDAIATLQFKAEALADWSQQKGGDLQTMQMAFSIFELLADYLDQLRSSYKTEESKIVIGTKWNSIYSVAIKVALQLFAITGEAQYKEKAFSFAEKNQAIVLAQSLQESRAKQIAGIPAALMEKEQDLRAQLTFYETEIAKEKQKGEKQGNDKLFKYQDRHFVLKRDYQKLNEQLENSHSKYYQLKYKAAIVSIADLQKSLDAKTALLEYFLGDSSIFIFAVAKDVFEVVALERDSTFNARVLTLANSLKNISSKADYLQNAAQLYNLLIKPIAFSIAKKPRWVIIPDGEVYQVPFEALLTKTVPPKHADYRSLPYLIKEHEISYHYSATLFLKSLREPVHIGYANFFAGFAPVFDAAAKNGMIYRDASEDSSMLSLLPKADSTFLATRDGKTLDPLPYSAQEVQDILAAFPSRSRAFLQQEASEENFKQQIKSYKYVHLATHGRMIEMNPKLSNLTFSQPQDNKAKENGILYSAETYNLDLNADLLVLSACQTGAGQILKGEGLMALTRGFFYSGARNIVASLWKVYDEHTSRLMVEFYREIAAGKTYSAALREAKLKMIADPATAAPQSWAGFVLMGK